MKLDLTILRDKRERANLIQLSINQQHISNKYTRWAYI